MVVTSRIATPKLIYDPFERIYINKNSPRGRILVMITKFCKRKPAKKLTPLKKRKLEICKRYSDVLNKKSRQYTFAAFLNMLALIFSFSPGNVPIYDKIGVSKNDRAAISRAKKIDVLKRSNPKSKSSSSRKMINVISQGSNSSRATVDYPEEEFSSRSNSNPYAQDSGKYIKYEDFYPSD
jgi:hypothetical protein